MILEAEGLDAAIAYFQGLEAAITRATKTLGSSKNLRQIEAELNEITTSTVYAQFEGDIFDPGTPPQMKEGALAEINDEGGIDAGMSMDAALLTKFGAQAGENTYAMFFLPEFYEKSVLRRNSSGDKLPIPFLDAWYAKLGESVPEALSEAVDQEIAR